eukprot:686311-Pelagomonas_calceolata.AAC.1
MLLLGDKNCAKSHKHELTHCSKHEDALLPPLSCTTFAHPFSSTHFSGPLAGAASPLAAASPAGAEVAVAAAAGVGALPERLSSGGSTDAMWLLSTGEATGASSVSACRLYICAQ